MFNKLLLGSGLFLVVFFYSLVGADKAFATVGGPTYISQIAFSASTSAVYYLLHDNGGRGCPPIIHTLDVNSNQDREVKNCDETLLLSEVQDAYNGFIADTYQNLRYLGSVSLSKNKIAINAEYVSDKKSDDGNEVYWREFDATVTQDGVVLEKIRFQGCSLDQPHVFEGYAIPNSDKLVLLLSNKGDCYEGGYVKEGLYLVKGVKYYDTNEVRGYKQALPTEPNSGNLVIYAGATAVEEVAEESLSTSTLPVDSPNTSMGLWFQMMAVVVATMVGVVAGYFLGKKAVSSAAGVESVL